MAGIRGFASAGCCLDNSVGASPRSPIKHNSEQEQPHLASVRADQSNDLLVGILECVRSIKKQHEAQHNEVVALLQAVSPERAMDAAVVGELTEVLDSAASPAEDAPAEVPANQQRVDSPSAPSFQAGGAAEPCEPEAPHAPLVKDEEPPSAPFASSSQPPRSRASTCDHNPPAAMVLSGFVFDDEFANEAVVIPPLKDGFAPFLCAVCKRCIRWRFFDHLIGAIILLNSLTIGYEAAEEVHGRSYAFISFIEPMFLGIYVIELIMRFVAEGTRANFAQPWVRFDIFLVGLGTFSMAIVEPIKSMVGSSEGSTESADQIALDALEWIMILRIMRLLRLLRALRLLSQFKTLWRLVQGLMSSLGTMLSTMALLFFVIYVFACIGLELITKDEGLKNHDNPEIQALVSNNFGSLPGVMLTLTQFVTLDSIAGLYSPLIMDKWWMIFYFLPLILVVPVALMNLVTANLVECAIAMGTDDKEMEEKAMKAFLKQLVPEIHEAFRLVDGDSSGVITRDEVENAADHLPAVFLEKLSGGDVVEFFETMDVDGSGEITEEEFVEGVLHFLMSDVPVETQQSLKLLRIMKEKLVLLEEVVFKLPGAPPVKSAHAFHKHDKKQQSLTKMLATRTGSKVL